VTSNVSAAAAGLERLQAAKVAPIVAMTPAPSRPRRSSRVFNMIKLLWCKEIRASG
jgi:hypothetical protein